MAFDGATNPMSYPKPVPQAQPNPTGLRRVSYPDQFNAEFIPEVLAKANSGLAAVRSYLGKARDTFDALNERRAMPDVMKTQAANEADVAALVAKAEDQLLDGWQGASAKVDEAIASAEAAVVAKANLKADEYGPEIRAAFTTMKTAGDRANALTKAVEQLDRQTLAALLNAPEYATGIPLETREGVKARFYEAVAPAETALVRNLRKARQYMDTADGQILKIMTKFYEGTQRHEAAQKRLASIKASFEI